MSGMTPGSETRNLNEGPPHAAGQEVDENIGPPVVAHIPLHLVHLGRLGLAPHPTRLAHRVGPRTVAPAPRLLLILAPRLRVKTAVYFGINDVRVPSEQGYPYGICLVILLPKSQRALENLLRVLLP